MSPKSVHKESQPERGPARSKNGCLTCRRRKVRCDKQRPLCSHCERLSLECRWHPRAATSANHLNVNPTFIHVFPSKTPTNERLLHSETEDIQRESRDSGSIKSCIQKSTEIENLFDYASFMWDGSDPLSQSSPEGPSMIELSSAQQPICLDASPESFTTKEELPEVISQQIHNLGSSKPMVLSDTVDDRHLFDYFVHTVVPPILADVETQTRWVLMRQALISMSNSSPMVRNSILAFSQLLWCRRRDPWIKYSLNYYDNASAELTLLCDSLKDSQNPIGREELLATLFFLIYVDILGERVQCAHLHLEKAYKIFHHEDINGFRPVELRLLSWIRLLDARAVSAGGEGLFLSETDELLLLKSSPSIVGDSEKDKSCIESPNLEIEEILFQTLYHPGIIFFQKVQSFMGRISKIDPWHRSRGTVEDETEVMNIAAKISKDLRNLYDNRPALMDPAVVGQLTPPHVSPNLAFTLTRVFRTYLSNYHASKVHLHRVAYKSFPLTNDTMDALKSIRDLARSIVGSLEPEGTLPASMLWPLLMWGSEEQEYLEREWIMDQISRMQKIATNANITAQVLEEVQRRQDLKETRVDIRSVMHEIFDSCFAIV